MATGNLAATIQATYDALDVISKEMIGLIPTVKPELFGPPTKDQAIESWSKRIME